MVGIVGVLLCKFIDIFVGNEEFEVVDVRFWYLEIYKIEYWCGCFFRVCICWFVLLL